MAPGPGFFFTREGLSDVTVPIHIDDPALDEVLKRPFSAERIRDLLPMPPEYSLVPGVGHHIYSAPCRPALRALFPEICCPCRKPNPGGR
jgi:predicted dienelactone hydrolase